MAKIDFNVNPMAPILDPPPNNIQLRVGDFVSFRPPATNDKVQVELIGTTVTVFVAPKFPLFQTFKFQPSPVLEGGDVVVRFRGLKTVKKKLPTAARKKKITFTIAVQGQNVTIRPKMNQTQIRSGSVVVFKLARGKRQKVLVELGNPQVYFGIAPVPPRDPRVTASAIFTAGIVKVAFADAGGGGGDTKPYP